MKFQTIIKIKGSYTDLSYGLKESYLFEKTLIDKNKFGFRCICEKIISFKEPLDFNKRPVLPLDFKHSIN